jgi:probable HAF family extracellular repeat protein
MNLHLRVGIFSIICLTCTRAQAAAATFTPLGDLAGGETYSIAAGVSGDGSVVVGTSVSASGVEAFRWTSAGGIVGLGDLPGATFDSRATAISTDGSTIVGSSITSQFMSPGSQIAFRWTQATGMVGLGDIAGGPALSDARAVSANGSVVVGVGFPSDYGLAFRWTQPSGMVGLGDLPGGNFTSVANAVSADGSVVGCTGSVSPPNVQPDPKQTGAFRWTSAGIAGLGWAPGINFSSAAAVSANGEIVAGSFSTDISTFGYRWTATTGFVPLPQLPDIPLTNVKGMSADGARVVGYSSAGTGASEQAILWDEQHGIQKLAALLTNVYGLNLAGWHLTEANAISADGMTIVGQGINPQGLSEGWRVQFVPEPSSCALLALGLAMFAMRTRQPVFHVTPSRPVSSECVSLDQPFCCGRFG